MSNDPEQEFFSDGITEDIITDLSKVSGLFVLGRNTVFTYKGKAVNLEQIAKQLGVAYVVEGSVRKAGNRVRINAQLIEGATGGHIWADRYDRDLTDIFAIQDEITKTIVEQLKVKLLPEEKKAIEQAPTDNVEAYTHYLRGRQFLHTATKSSLTAWLGGCLPGRWNWIRASRAPMPAWRIAIRVSIPSMASRFRPTKSWRPLARPWRSSPIWRKPMPRAATP